jgi:hypothetical protein
MKLNNSQKVTAAEKVAEYARHIGFPQTYLLFEVPGDDSFFDNFDALVDEYRVDAEASEVDINIHLMLDEEFNVQITDTGDVLFPV